MSTLNSLNSTLDGSSSKRLKIVVTGGHPGDPEYGCGGTIALYVAAGHEVALLYLNDGEPQNPADPSTVKNGVRVAEAQRACEILRARPIFAAQTDGDTVIDAGRYDEYRSLLEVEQPDIVFAHWPIDNHPDHRANWLLVYNAWQKMGKSFALYYYEVTTGEDTQMFVPTHYVDITDVEPLKRAACYAHASQDPDRFYDVQRQTSLFRGIESRRRHAEAYIRQADFPSDRLPTR